MEEKFLILYNNDEYEFFEGSFEDCIKHLKEENRYYNYGHNGATIASYQKKYSINFEMTEKHFGKNKT